MIYLALLLAWLLMPRKKRRKRKRKTVTRKTVYYKPAAACSKARDRPPAYKPEKQRRSVAVNQLAEARQAEAEKKKIFQQQQAAADLEFYITRQDAIIRQLWIADSKLQEAEAQLEKDRYFSAVTTDKQLARHEAELLKARRAQATLESQLHATEKQIAKCNYILSSA